MFIIVYGPFHFIFLIDSLLYQVDTGRKRVTPGQFCPKTKPKQHLFDLFNFFTKSALAAGASISTHFLYKQCKLAVVGFVQRFDQVGTGRRRVNLDQFHKKQAQNAFVRSA